MIASIALRDPLFIHKVYERERRVLMPPPIESPYGLTSPSSSSVDPHRAQSLSDLLLSHQEVLN